MPKTAALFVISDENDYTKALYNGVREALFERGYGLVYESATLQEYHDAKPEHLIGSLESAAAVDYDAYIVVAGSIRMHMNARHHSFGTWLASLPREKTLIVEEFIAGYRCLYKDNRPGMHELMRHLLDTCEFKKVGMVSGPSSSYSAREREAVWREEMAAHGLPIRRSWFARGDYAGSINQDSIEEFVAHNRDLDAIVCATDSLAKSVYAALRKIGLRPGIDVAVTGHDDQTFASSMHPALTTISLDPFDFGYESGLEAVRMMEDEPARTTAISGHLIVRNSCGEHFRNEFERYHELVQQTPFPTQEVASVLMEAGTKLSLAHAESRFGSAILSLVEAIQSVYERRCTPREALGHINTKFVALFVDGARNGVVRLASFLHSSNTLMTAVLACTDPAHRREVSSLMTGINEAFNQLVSKRYLAADSAEAKRSIAMGRIVQSSLQVTDPVESTRQVMESIRLAGLEKACVLSFSKPPTWDGHHYNLPDTVDVRGVMDEKGIEAHAPGEVSIPLGSIRSLMEDDEGTHIYSRIGLYDGELLGYFIARTDEMTFTLFYLISLQLAYALRHQMIVQHEEHLIDVLGETNTTLQRESRIDVLSGLLNRRGFEEELRQSLATATAPHAALYFLDLDWFKQINDTYGHEEGDEAIKAVGAILKKSLRADDLVARMGGDEFVFLAFLESPDEANVPRQRIEALLEAFNRSGAKPYQIYASIGTHVFSVSPDADVEEAMARADEDLYAVKERHHEQARTNQPPEGRIYRTQTPDAQEPDAQTKFPKRLAG